MKKTAAVQILAQAFAGALLVRENPTAPTAREKAAIRAALTPLLEERDALRRTGHPSARLQELQAAIERQAAGLSLYKCEFAERVTDDGRAFHFIIGSGDTWAEAVAEARRKRPDRFARPGGLPKRPYTKRAAYWKPKNPQGDT